MAAVLQHLLPQDTTCAGEQHQLRGSMAPSSKPDSCADIDPNAYLGQPEYADLDDVPSVLRKLQKWGDYDSFGTPVWPSKFVPMKTPLAKSILSDWKLPEAPKHSLTVEGLLEAQTAANRRIGLILDLSNHDCLYEEDVPADVAYIHVQLVAKEFPPLESVQEVGRIATEFWDKHPDEYIAIHCAYGEWPQVHARTY